MSGLLSSGLDWLASPPSAPLRGLSARSPGAHALRCDGLALEIWPGELRARDLAAGAAERIAAVRALVPPGGVLARQSAVWALTGLFRPTHLDVVLTGARRRSSRHVRIHAERLAPADVVLLGRRAHTSPARTAVDIARWSSAEDALRWLDALDGRGLLRRDEVAASLERALGSAGVVRARGLLRPFVTPAAA